MSKYKPTAHPHLMEFTEYNEHNDNLASICKTCGQTLGEHSTFYVDRETLERINYESGCMELSPCDNNYTSVKIGEKPMGKIRLYLDSGKIKE